MANTNKPTGLTPVSYLNGSDWDGRVNIYQIAAADTNAFYVGDPVVPSGDGDTVRGIPGVTIGTPGTGPWVGSVVAIGTNPDGGPYINPSNLERVFRPSGAQTQQYYVAVADDPNIIFEIQEVGTGTQLTSAEIWLNANMVAAAPATGVVVSGYQLTNSTEGTSNALDLKLMGLVRRYDNGAFNAFGQYAKWRVMINNHAFKSGVTGV